MFKKEVIEFYPNDNTILDLVPPPQPGIHANLPTWLRQTPKYRFGHTEFVLNNGLNNLSVRNCIPFLESFTSGYVFTLPCDIQVRVLENGRYRFDYNGNIGFPSPITVRPSYEEQEPAMPLMDGYEKLEFNWMPVWSIKTAPGYSCLFMHPINRVDLPFYTLGGVIDTDRWGEAGNHPFLFKKGWQGILEKGTPLFQVFPFKRQGWVSKVNTDMGNTYWKKISERDKSLKDWYKKNAWSNKSYK